MSKKRRLIRRLVEEWIQRFGEPPPIATDPALMRAVLASSPRRIVESEQPAAEAA